MPPPSASEQALLDRLLAGPSVRLACQLRPRKDITALPLLPAASRHGDPARAGDDLERLGEELGRRLLERA